MSMRVELLVNDDSSQAEQDATEEYSIGRILEGKREGIRKP